MRRAIRETLTRLGSVLCVLAVALVDAGCSVDDVDYEGKLCNAEAPCPGDYTCKEGTCCTGTFSVTNFKVDWKTPNTVRLSWTPPENAKADHVKYVVVIGKSESELRTLEQQALANQDDGPRGGIRTADDNPELGQYELRQSSGFDVVDATSIDVLEPATEYRVELLSFDSGNCASSTQSVVVRTDQKSFSHVLFDDVGHPNGEPRPFGAATFANQAGLAFEGDTYVSWPGPAVEGDYENVGVAQLQARMGTHFPTLDFTTAFLEAAVALDGNPVAVWGEARLLLGPTTGGCGGAVYQFSPYAFPSGSDYRVIQIPLSQFVESESALTVDELSTRDVCEISFGQSFAIEQGIRVDAIRLGW